MQALFRRLLGLGIGSLWLALPSTGFAQVSCTAVTSPGMLNAGTIVPWRAQGHPVTASIAVHCTNNFVFPYWTTACLSVEAGSAGTSVAARRISINGTTDGLGIPISITSNNAAFGSFYAGASSIQTSAVQIYPFASGNYFTVPIEVAISSGQANAVPGTYASSYAGPNTSMAVSATLIRTPDCSLAVPTDTNAFEFSVSATVPDFCEFTGSIPNMAFSPTTGVRGPKMAASTLLPVRCTNSTPYKISLRPSNNDVNGHGLMTPVNAPGNSDTVPYTLYQDIAQTMVWGALPTNGQSGTGTGNPQSWTVHGVVPADLNVTPGSYKDNVIVTVTY